MESSPAPETSCDETILPAHWPRETINTAAVPNQTSDDRGGEAREGLNSRV